MLVRGKFRGVMDAFAILGIDRKLAVSDEELRAAFREAGKSAHPDAGGAHGDFSSLQEAFAILSSPSRRLKHWLALHGESGEDRGTIRDELVDLFSAVGPVLQRVDALIRRRDEARSALTRAMLEGESNICREQLDEMIGRVDDAIKAETENFPTLGSAYPIPTAEAARTARNLAFLEKWRAQLRERFSRLIG